MRFVVTPSPPHLHEIVPVTWHVEFIPPSIFTNMFPPNLVCHDEMMASFAIFAILLKKKVSYMKKQPDLFLNPIKHLLKKTHSSITWLSFFSIHCKGQSGIRRHVDRRHVHLSCTWQPAHKLLPIKFITYDVTVNWLHQDWWCNAATTATHSFRDELLSRCVFKQLPCSNTAYKLYVLPPQCAVVAGFHPLLSSLHRKHHENLVANRASGGRLFMVLGHLLGKKRLVD